jgi:DNA-binding transcriptional LysR family regulator
MAVTATQLQSFLAVVETGSVTAAAERLVVSQPSVSAAVSALERELGVALTEKAGRGLRLTEAGTVYATYAASLLGLADDGRRAAREAAGHEERTLRIAAVTTAGEFVAPPLMQAFARRHRDVDLELEVGNRAHVFRRTAAREVDVAIGGRPPTDGRLRGFPFQANDYVVVGAPGDAHAAPGGRAIGDLASRRWLVREEGSGTRRLVIEHLAENGVEPRLLTLGSNGAISHAAAIGLGVALVPRATVELELESGILVDLAVAGLPTRHWYALVAADGPVRPVVETFLAFIDEMRTVEGKMSVIS